MTLRLGIDVGGTKVAAGTVDTETGEILRYREELTQANLGGRSVLTLCEQLRRDLDAQELAVGIGLCELVDIRGRIQSGVTVDWRDLHLAAALGPVTVESDVRAAATAEARFGAGRGSSNFLYLSIGTGISHTLVLGGQPYAGAHGYAIILGAPPVEVTSSGAALASTAGADTYSVLTDPIHESLVESASQSLGQSLAFLIHALDPGAVVIGGGLGSNAKYRGRVIDATRAHLTEKLSNTPILAAGLGKTAGVVGAALAAASSS